MTGSRARSTPRISPTQWDELPSRFESANSPTEPGVFLIYARGDTGGRVAGHRCCSRAAVRPFDKGESMDRSFDASDLVQLPTIGVAGAIALGTELATQVNAAGKLPSPISRAFLSLDASHLLLREAAKGRLPDASLLASASEADRTLDAAWAARSTGARGGRSFRSTPTPPGSRSRARCWSRSSPRNSPVRSSLQVQGARISGPAFCVVGLAPELSQLEATRKKRSIAASALDFPLPLGP